MEQRGIWNKVTNLFCLLTIMLALIDQLTHGEYTITLSILAFITVLITCYGAYRNHKMLKSKSSVR